MTVEIDDYDWFLKADDDSFIVMENLRAFLSKYSPHNDNYFGRHFSVPGTVVGESFVSGAAYVLSRSSLRRLVNEAFPNHSICPTPSQDAHEDVNLGFCLRNIGIYPGETRDSSGRQRFLVFSPWVHLMVGAVDSKNWIRRYDKFGYVEGGQCCSDTAILLHYVPGGYMLAIEYLLYHLRPLGSNTASGSKIIEMLPTNSTNEFQLRKNLAKLGYVVGSNRFSTKTTTVKSANTVVPRFNTLLPV